MEKYISSNTLSDLAEVILKHNIIKFGKKIVTQKTGTAIQARFARCCSNLFMEKFEEKILRKVEFKPHLLWRYIDDIFFLWDHGIEKLKSFIHKINKTHSTNKITVDWSKTSIHFLNVTASITVGITEVDLYVKSTGSYPYLLLSLLSCHSFYYKKGITYSQALRPNKLCFNNEFLEKIFIDLEKYLLETDAVRK